ncbi:hypothetical protein B0T25DRAFT_573235 [Lasiosphaeria hispida]|uniref:2EXR domain-containing protein n=1 Tax=Lasiosphaeria hispida TaxID=260671 RepID=A0AAJ0M9V4_9PEZI|nr:hypothetical protein B0T25DRAFT_573235 [Lasiosphaeria hispida]
MESLKLETFYLFLYLPEEIKRMIWRAAASVPRVILLDREERGMVTKSIKSKTASDASDTPDTPAPAPGFEDLEFSRLCPLLYVNHSSRAAVRTIYFTVFQVMRKGYCDRPNHTDNRPASYRTYDIAEHDAVVFHKWFGFECRPSIICSGEEGYEEGLIRYRPPNVQLAQRRRPGVVVSPSQTPVNFILMNWSHPGRSEEKGGPHNPSRFDPLKHATYHLTADEMKTCVPGRPPSDDPWRLAPCIKHVVYIEGPTAAFIRRNVGLHPEFRRVLVEAVARGIVPGTPMVDGEYKSTLRCYDVRGLETFRGPQAEMLLRLGASSRHS